MIEKDIKLFPRDWKCQSEVLNLLLRRGKWGILLKLNISWVAQLKFQPQLQYQLFRMKRNPPQINFKCHTGLSTPSHFKMHTKKDCAGRSSHQETAVSTHQRDKTSLRICWGIRLNFTAMIASVWDESTRSMINNATFLLWNMEVEHLRPKKLQGN